LLSVPLTMVVKIALESSKSGNWLAILLSDDVEDKFVANNTENSSSDGDDADTSTTESK